MDEKQEVVLPAEYEAWLWHLILVLGFLGLCIGLFVLLQFLRFALQFGRRMISHKGAPPPPTAVVVAGKNGGEKSRSRKEVEIGKVEKKIGGKRAEESGKESGRSSALPSRKKELKIHLKSTAGDQPMGMDEKVEKSGCYEMKPGPHQEATNAVLPGRPAFLSALPIRQARPTRQGPPTLEAPPLPENKPPSLGFVAPPPVPIIDPATDNASLEKPLPLPSTAIKVNAAPVASSTTTTSSELYNEVSAVSSLPPTAIEISEALTPLLPAQSAVSASVLTPLTTAGGPLPSPAQTPAPVPVPSTSPPAPVQVPPPIDHTEPTT